MREKVMKNTASFILISLLLASIFAGAVSGAGVGVGGVEENENLDQEEKGNDGVGNANVTAASSITCNSCEDCSNKLNGKYDTVILTRDLINVKGSCITFGANNVVFDGNGHKIDGDDTGEFESGITMSSMRGNTIKNCVITDFESGITLYESSKNKIYDNEVSSNYYDGIWISTNSDSNNIHDNRIENNGNYGIYFSSDSNNNIFSKNVVCSNPTDIRDVDKNSGDENTCDTTSNWNDYGTTGCTYSCPEEKPDLLITEIICDSENKRVGYKIKNVGDATASKGHYTTLFVDGAFKIKEQVNVDLTPGASSQRYFDYYSWQCTPPQDTVKVCADYGNFVDESNEKNNCLEKTCECAPPEKPDLTITDVWNEDSTICYQIRNIGNATAPKGHYTALSIDGEPVVNDLVDVELAPKERLKQCFNYGWQCSPPDDTVTVCADYKDVVDEGDETNNCRNETWKCDNTPPVIVSGPVVSEVTQSSVTISWTTNEDSDSLVRFGRTAGKYEDQKSSLKLKQEHKVILKDILPSTTYHYVVESTDASENTVASRDGFFETSPLPDDEPPVVHALDITRGKGDFLYYELSADATDNIGVERVEFYIDDRLIGTDYSAPYQSYMDPASIGMMRDEFFEEHTVAAVAFDDCRVEARLPALFDPPYECEHIGMEMRRPHPDYTIYIEGDTVPAGTIEHIEVYAALEQERCILVDCIRGAYGEMQCGGSSCKTTVDPISQVEFYVNHAPIPHTSAGCVHTANWDASGLPPGTYAIRVDAIASEGCEQTIIRYVEIEHGEPSLDVSREVTRIGNYFRVELTVSNSVRGTVNAVFDRIEDNVDGFQPIKKSDAAEHYEVTFDCSPDARSCNIEIDPSSSTGGASVTLEPGEDLTVEYLVVPVLYPDSVAPEYAIGADQVRVVDYWGVRPESFAEPCVYTSDGHRLHMEVDLAKAASDYLIVTDPERLFDLHAGSAVNDLLSAMAELAQLKTGILGYVSGPDSSDPHRVDDYIEDWGYAMMRGSDDHDIEGDYLSNGYLLIVGENEIIPARSWSRDAPWYASWLHSFDVDATDLHYANTAGDTIDPELIVGRVIGNNARELLIPLQTSIDVHKGTPGHSFDRSQALIATGFQESRSGGSDHINFASEARAVRSRILDYGASPVTIVDFTDYVSRTLSVRVFFANTTDMDIVHLVGHGSPDSMDDLWDSDFNTQPDPFADANPFVYGSSCLTGRYMDGTSLAEKFLQRGTALYLGSTEVSYCCPNTVVAKKIYSRWDADESIGSVLRGVKRDIGGWRWDDYESGHYEDLWTAEYQLYGDPKFGQEVSLATYSTGCGTVKAAAEPQASIEVMVPDYEITTTAEGESYVSIPDGFMVFVPGKPLVPLYDISLEYPRGYRVQDIVLTNRSSLSSTTGLNIPNFTPLEAGNQNGEEMRTATSSEWWPERIFDWTIRENPDGTSVLMVKVYPFYYNPLTTDVRFYKNYSFDIDYLSSTVEIAALTTDKNVYQQGDDVLIDFWLNNSGDAQGVIVDAVVRAEDTDEVVDGLLLRSLDNLTGLASFSPQWDSNGVEPGYYYIEAEVRDTSGNVLDRRMEQFRLGISSGEIASFTATPEYFEIGDTIEMEMAFKNNGTVNIIGTAVIRVLHSTGDAVEEFRHNVTDLIPSESISFSDTWDTSGAEEGSYNIVGYVLYDSKATSPATVIVTSVPIEKKPDLEIVKKWENWVDKEKGTYTVTYVVHNNGTTVAPAGHHTTLYIDEEPVEHKPVPVTLKPYDTDEDTFKTVVKCTPPEDKITVCADNYDKVEELDEGNNCMTNVWQCPVPAKKPDLVINDIKLTKMDGYCYVDYLISNTGTVSASASTTYLYVDDKKVASDSTGALASGASRWERFTAYRTTGAHTYEVCADGPNAISETNEANNCRKDKLRCPEVKKPDLVIKDIKLSREGNYCYVDYLISNTGTVSASASTTYLYVDDKKVASDSTGALASGASRWERFTAYRTTGAHTYEVCADGPNAISETDEANNCRKEKLRCPEVKKPDLVINDIKLTKMEGYCYVDYLISNTGTTSAAASTTYLYVYDKKVASDSTSALASGASRWDRFTYRATGSHTFKVCADGPNAISETNEVNNCRTEELTCPEKPDLVITKVWHKYDSKTKKTIVYYTIKNQGKGTAGASKAYMSWYPSGKLISTDDDSSLSAGQTRTESFAPYPFSTTGFDINICADGNHKIAETNEANNCKRYYTIG
jgi:parallel beta-helix repeat protein